ncbi:hypothetical protein BS78_04G226600 [Paspalum vaginatum]|nr:hypothetical protein BS78_04G226600 [Paspalum vaginatum]
MGRQGHRLLHRGAYHGGADTGSRNRSSAAARRGAHTRWIHCHMAAQRKPVRRPPRRDDILGSLPGGFVLTKNSAFCRRRRDHGFAALATSATTNGSSEANGASAQPWRMVYPPTRTKIMHRSSAKSIRSDTGEEAPPDGAGKGECTSISAGHRSPRDKSS